MSLSTKDYKNILDIVDTLYSVPDKHKIFQVACQRLRDFLGICSAVFIPADPETGAFLVDGYEIFANSESAMLTYLAHYAALDPLSLTGCFLTYLNDSARNAHLVPENKLPKSACDFLISHAVGIYVLGSALSAHGDLVGIFAIHRQKEDKDFSEREKEIFNIILPHMARALRSINMLNGGLKSDSGFIAVGEDGSICFMNEIAKAALGDMPLNSIPGPDLDSSFFSGKNGMFRVRTVPVVKGKGGKVILLERHPSDTKIHAMLEEFRLGNREREVASLAVQGLSNREIAAALFICEQTVKDYLYDIFGKLGVKRRSELAAKVFKLN